MSANDMNVHANSVSQLASEFCTGGDYSTEIVDCRDLKQLFDLLGSSEADHIAIVNSQQEQISDIFGYVQAAFLKQEAVSVALFFSKNRD